MVKLPYFHGETGILFWGKTPSLWGAEQYNQDMAKKETIDINELVQDDHNFNRGTERGQELIVKSFKEFGAGRSVLVDKNNRLIGGNKAQLGAIEAGITKARIVETTGDELVVVKRTDIDLDTEKGRQMAMADNATQQANLEWNEDEINAAREQWGVTPEDWDVDMLDQENGYPAELEGIDKNPDKLDKIEGDDETEMQRVIITFKEEQKEMVAALLGLAEINKVIYDYDELIS